MDLNIKNRIYDIGTSQVCLFPCESGYISNLQAFFNEQSLTLFDHSDINSFLSISESFEYAVIDEDYLQSQKSDLFSILASGVKVIILAARKHIKYLSKIPNVVGFLLKDSVSVSNFTFISNNVFYKGPLHEKCIELTKRNIMEKEVLSTMLKDILAQNVISLKKNLYQLSKVENNNYLTRQFNTQASQYNYEHIQSLADIAENLISTTDSVNRNINLDCAREHPGLILNQLLLEYQQNYTGIQYNTSFKGDNYLGSRVGSNFYLLLNCVMEYLSRLKLNNTIQIDMSFFDGILGFEMISEGSNSFDGLKYVVSELFDSMHIHCMLVDDNYSIRWSKVGYDRFSIGLEFSTVVYN